MLGSIGICAADGGARAEERSPSTEGSRAGDETSAPTGSKAGHEDTTPTGGAELSSKDQKLLAEALASEDVIVVWGARETRVYDRDTPLRLTGADLRKRGISNVAEALELLPEVYVRAAGRGGRQIDVRGARKGSVKILLDGIAIGDPYYGNIDLSAIPVTDIEQIRVSAAPASPIDGPGGPGGVIEIFTRDAVGPSGVRARLTGSNLPSAEASVTGHAMLAPQLAARVSASVVLGAQDYELLDGNRSTFVSEDKQQSVGSVRIEYREGERRLVTDIWTQQVAFVVPPSSDGASNILVIKGESQGRLGINFDDSWQKTRVAARAHYHLLSRDSTYYEDPALEIVAQEESLAADRSGLALLANRPIGNHWFMIGSANLESDHADVDGFDAQNTEGRATISQAAGAVHYDGEQLAIKAAGGVAVPLGLGADPWAEFKLSASYLPIPAVTLKFSSGHKGRTPTLRERYRLDIGNKSLGPEKALFAEAGASLAPIERIRLTLTSYARRTNGLIRFDGTQSMLVNTEDLDIIGIEGQLEGDVTKWARGGASWAFSEANSEILGPNPLDFFPKHRGAAWLSAETDRGGVTARLQYYGTQIDRSTELPAHTLVQLTAHTTIYDDYQLNVRAENVSGRVYEERVGVRAPGRTAFLSLQGEWR